MLYISCPLCIYQSQRLPGLEDLFPAIGGFWGFSVVSKDVEAGGAGVAGGSGGAGALGGFMWSTWPERCCLVSVTVVRAELKRLKRSTFQKSYASLSVSLSD